MHDIAEESRRFDPSGNYVRRWIPALSRMPFKYIHNPSMVSAALDVVQGARGMLRGFSFAVCLHQAPGNVLLEAGVELGINYPFPIISPEESTRQLNYACDVIARCCPNPPQYRKEPYYPPSDPRLDPESSNTPWQLPMHGEHESGKVLFHNFVNTQPGSSLFVRI